MEGILNEKHGNQARGRWSVRLSSELLDYVDSGSFSWEEIASFLGFTVEVTNNVKDHNRSASSNMSIC